MLKRREFIQRGLLLSAALNTPISHALSVSDGVTKSQESSVELFSMTGKVLIDNRSIESKHFGLEAQRHGVSVEEIHDDPTRVWYEVLQPLLSSSSAQGLTTASDQKKMVVAGYTTREVTHCLELLGHRQGARLVYQERYPNEQGFVSWLMLPRGISPHQLGVDS